MSGTAIESDAGRRAFLASLGGWAAAAGLLPGALAPAPAGAVRYIGPRPLGVRVDASFLRRVRAALQNRREGSVEHPSNGDEESLESRIGSFTKGLPHDAHGEVLPSAYRSLIRALRTGRPELFEAVQMGCPDPEQQRKLVNPQAGLAFDLEGRDSHQLFLPPAPCFESAEEAAEMVEVYWMALLRDVPFEAYATHPLALQAAAELSALSDFRGPKENGAVTPRTLFRDELPGALTGPYISQFFLKTCPFGANFVEQKIRTKIAGLDHMTDYGEWLAIQNGCFPLRAEVCDPVRRYIRNGRDIASWVHIDVLFQAYFQAALMLLAPLNPGDPQQAGLGAPLNPGNPYEKSLTQVGFGTFGPPYIATILAEVSTRALKAVWFQKWFVHRRLRPEAFAGAIHNKIVHGRDYPIHDDALNSQAAALVHAANGTYLLPMAFPEGSPLHPAYGAGHATVAGACVTILKALFDGDHVISDPIMPSPDGLNLVPYPGPPLTVEGELNKIASNVATGRNHAGVHWRTDAIESLKLGEAVAISILRDQRLTYNERFEGFSFRKFDGTTVTV